MSVIIEDKNGVELQFGDTVMDERPTSINRYYRFCYGYKPVGKRPPLTYAIVLDDDGDSHMISARHGILHDFIRIEAAEDYRFTPVSHLVDCTDGKACEYCGSPIAVRSCVDDITPKDNRFCYFCGAEIGG